VTLYYPPFNTIASHRTRRIVKGLRNNGYKVSVITAKRTYNNELDVNPDDTYYLKLLNVDSLLKSQHIRKNKLLFTFVKLLNRFFFFHRNYLPEFSLAIWRRQAIRVAQKIHKKTPVSLIYTSSGPPASAIVGYHFKKKTNVKWIAEFRDLWSFNHYYPLNKLLFKYNLRKEKHYLSGADEIITVTKYLRDQLRTLHNKPTHIIYNAFDIDMSSTNKSSSKFIITYAGNIIQGKRDPSPLFEGINELEKIKSPVLHNFEIRFFTNQTEYLDKLINKYEISKYVKNSGYIPHKEIQKELSICNLFLLLSYNHPIDKGVLTGKIFEYLSYRKPILAISYPGEIKEVLNKTGSGIVLNDSNDIAKFLIKVIGLSKKDSLLGFNMNYQRINSFSADNQNRKLHDLINGY